VSLHKGRISTKSARRQSPLPAGSEFGRASVK
jgi:hypothetical protein